MLRVMANTEWPRTLLAIGFVTILAGVAIGAATDGNPAARYVALAGVLPISAAVVGLVVQRLLRFWDVRRTAPER
jgi:hypothetical protein